MCRIIAFTSGGIKLCTRNALSKVVSEFAARDPLEMAELSGASFVDNSILMHYCGLPVKVTYPKGEVNFHKTGKNFKIPEPTHEEKVVLLQYLTSASGLPVRGQWHSFLDLRGGPLHWKPFQKEALEPLAQSYYNRKEKFLDLGMKHGGRPFEKGDAGVVIPVLPRLPLAFILWEGDEEFPPRAMILFDTVSEAYLSTAGLFVLGIQAVMRIWFPVDTRFDSQN